MTEKRARAFHRAMWRWLAKHHGKRKWEWPGWMLGEKDDEISDVFWTQECFACFVVNRKCKKCPIKEKAGLCDSGSDLFSEYRLMGFCTPPAEWADVCNRMADAWREIPKN